MKFNENQALRKRVNSVLQKGGTGHLLLFVVKLHEQWKTSKYILYRRLWIYRLIFGLWLTFDKNNRPMRLGLLREATRDMLRAMLLAHSPPTPHPLPAAGHIAALLLFARGPVTLRPSFAPK